MQVHILNRTGDYLFSGFRSIEDAIKFKAGRNLDADWRISDERPGERVDPLRDPLLLIGVKLRDALTPLWRNEQYDRLLDGRSHHFPEHLSAGLSAPTAIVVTDILEAAGFSGWQAETGYIENEDGSRDHHSWAVHETGVVLDLAAESLGLHPVAVSELDTPLVKNYVATADHVDSSDMERAWSWGRRIGPALINELSEFEPIYRYEPEVEPEMAGP